MRVARTAIAMQVSFCITYTATVHSGSAQRMVTVCSSQYTLYHMIALQSSSLCSIDNTQITYTDLSTPPVPDKCLDSQGKERPQAPCLSAPALPRQDRMQYPICELTWSRLRTRLLALFHNCEHKHDSD